jgi:methionyl-tRNA formyltransferase
MLEFIILLSGLAENAILAELLTTHNPGLVVHQIRTLAELDALPLDVLEHARLIAFATGVIVPQRILARLGFGAYNFHPGSPYYPGWLPAHLACYERAPLFGATLHEMVERVDAGPIVGVDLFNVPPGLSPSQLEILAFKRMAALFWSWAKALASEPNALPTIPLAWHGRKSTRRLYASMCEIPADISKAELDRRIAVFGGGETGLRPTINVHGHRFQYVKESAAAVPVMPAEQRNVA